VVTGASQTASHAFPACASVLASILSVGVMIHAAGELDDAVKKNDKTGEAAFYFSAAAFGMVHQVGMAIEKISELIPERSRLLGMSQKNLNRLFWVGKGFGIIAGGIYAGLDWRNAGKAKQNEQYGMMTLYGISAAGNVSSMLLIVAGSSRFGIPLFLLSVTLMLAIAIIKDNKQQEWLGRGTFGKDKADKYPTLEAEVEAFNGLYQGAEMW
jgi:hypothetical protein